jgi:hypothetical protein
MKIENMNKEVANNFVKNVRSELYSILGGAWAEYIRVYYDDDKYAVKDFVISASHSWGTAYCNWAGRAMKNEISAMLKSYGATNIKIINDCCQVRAFFDMKKTTYKSLLKELETKTA